jgi:hypothetical protein
MIRAGAEVRVAIAPDDEKLVTQAEQSGEIEISVDYRFEGI